MSKIKKAMIIMTAKKTLTIVRTILSSLVHMVQFMLFASFGDNIVIKYLTLINGLVH